MAKKRTNEIAVGLTVLVVLALTIFILVVLGFEDFFKPKQQITVTMPYQEGLKGLTKGSPVYLGGTKIGRIIEVDIDEEPDKNNEVYVYFTMEIPQKYRLFRDCSLEAKSNVLGGQASLVINDMGTKKPQIKGDIPVRLRIEGGIADAMKKISRELDANEPNSLLTHLKQIAIKINEQVTIEMDENDQTLMVKVHDIADNLTSATRELASTDPNSLLTHLKQIAIKINEQVTIDMGEDEQTLMVKVHEIADYLNSVSRELKDQMDTNDPNALLKKLHETLCGLQQTNLQVQSLLRSTDGPKALSNVEEILADLDEAIRRINLLIKHQYPNIDQAIQNLVEGAGHFKEGLSDVKQQPSQLIWGQPPPPKSENIK